MSYPPDQPGGPYPSRDPREQPEYPPRDNRESEYPPPPSTEYPPPPGEEDSRPRAYHQRAPSSSGVTLPSMSQAMPAYEPQQQYGPPNGHLHPDPRYSYPPPPAGYGRDDRGYPPDYARGGPPNMQFQQSAPRQRTAIACRYCRRRKIRCSGFDQSPDGRCGNCQRFQQECIFTPVSSQAQAFVPAHAVYPQMRNMAVGPDGRPQMMYPQGQQLYGAHGQPLGTVQAAQPPPQRGSPYGDYHPAPSPTGSYSSFTDERGESRKRPQAEPHTAILPPPVPGQPAYRDDGANRRQPAGEELRLPPVTPSAPPAAPASNYSPGSNASPAPANLRPPQEAGGPPASRTPPPRTSPSERSDPMSLGNIVERGPPPSDIDRGMLGRLDRKGPSGQEKGQSQ